MYRALKNTEGKTLLLTGTAISFYVVSGGNRPYVEGDCTQLITTT